MQQRFRQIALFDVLSREFSGYRVATLRSDLLAGITVGAVALPLSLAFGIASGATAGAGLITAILAGVIIGVLGGAGYQISGPTGAMSAVLIVLASRYGLEGIWVAGVLSGIMIFLVGIFNLGKIVFFIPTSVISGFTSGIALIIFIGQIDNLLGVTTPAAENSVVKLTHYFSMDQSINFTALAISLAVIVLMVVWPKSWSNRFPASLMAIILSTIVAGVLNLDIQRIGEIPQTLLLDARLLPQNIPWEHLGDLISPAISIAALGTIESLLCGAVGGRMTGRKMAVNQELLAQGIGNVIIPFFGGVPATAAIARSSVAIKSGGQTRVVSIVHSLVLLLAALVFAPQLSQVPLAALAGVLAVTAWRINEWDEIRSIFGKRLVGAMVAFTITMLATVALDLTQAIIIGFGLSVMVFVYQSSKVHMTTQPVSADALKASDALIKVVNVTGPLFFGSANTFSTGIENLPPGCDVILDMHAVSLMDITGVRAIEESIQQVESQGGRLYLNGLTAPVRAYLDQAGVLQQLGESRVFDDAHQAIVAADNYRAELASQMQGA